MGSYNFMRGKQMIIHDPRLNNPHTKPPTPLKPPAAYNVWTVSRSKSAKGIIAWAADVATGVGKLDALHFMAHGSSGSLQMGADGISWKNVELFKKLKGKVGCIVFLACKVGRGTRESYSLNFGNAVAHYASSKCVCCYANQMYGWGKDNVINFGEFEGTVYVYTPSGGTKALNPSRLEVKLGQIVFGK